MPLVFCGIAPHPPVAIPEVGRGRDREIKDTQDAMLQLGKRLLDKEPEVLVMITPHGPVFSDAVGVYKFDSLDGDLGMFGAPAVNFRVDAHPLSREIIRAADRSGVPAVEVDAAVMERAGTGKRLDHGITVPLYFLRQAGVDLPVVLVSMGMLPYPELYRFGMAVQQAVEEMNARTALVASGDLSHRLTPGAPAGYDPAGGEFDETLVDLVSRGDVRGIANLDPGLVQKAGECGLRPIIMALGALDGVQLDPQVLSYQGPFGVGYMVADLRPGFSDPERQFLRVFEGEQQEEAREQGSELVQLAREALENHVQGKETPAGRDLPEELQQQKAGVFVSLKKQGQLRGCIGTIEPVQDNLSREVMENAVSAGTRDPRFPPVRAEELDELEYSVDVLGEPEPVQSLDELDPGEYGVIVRSGGRKGLLLPALEGIDTAEEQVSIAMQKAGIAPGEEIEIERFQVRRYT